MSYDDALDEALCHGWIDSIIKRIDDDTYARKFTPRTDKQNWSELNKKRVARLIEQGRMTDYGLAKVNYLEPAVQAALKSEKAAKGETLARGCAIRFKKERD